MPRPTRRCPRASRVFAGDLKRMPRRSCSTSPSSCRSPMASRARKQDIIFAILKVLTAPRRGRRRPTACWKSCPTASASCARPRPLPRRPRRHLHQPVADPPLQPAHRRPPLRPHPLAEGRRTLLRAEHRRHHQRRAAGGLEEQGPVREPHPAVPAQALQARARRRFHRGHRRPHPRPDGAAGQGPARADRLAAQGRQDDDAAADRQRHHLQPSGRAPDRAADRRAPGGSHRNAAHRARRR